MSFWIKQSTAVTINMGPFLDSTDGNTHEEALSIAQADIRLSKNGADFAQTNNSAGATHIEHGWYHIPLDTTDTGTLGTLQVYVHVSGALPCWFNCMVVPANVWDSLFGADYLQVDTIQWSGTAVHTPGTAGVPIVDIHDQATALIDAIWDEVVTSGHTTAGSAGKLMSDNINAPLSTIDTVVDGIETHVHQIDSRILGTLAAGTHNAQSGDAYARLGAPAGASIAADLVVIDNFVDDLETRLTAARAGYLDNINNAALQTTVAQTGDAYARLGAPAGASVSADILVIDNFVDDLESRLTAARAGYLDNINNAALQTTVAQTGDAYALVNSGTYGNSALKTLIDAIEVHVHQTDSRVIGTLATGTHNPQTGDSYAIVNSGTYGNSALKTLIDAVDDFVDTEVAAIKTVVDLIEDIVRNRLDVTDATGAATLYNDAGSAYMTCTITDDSTTTSRTRLVT